LEKELNIFLAEDNSDNYEVVKSNLKRYKQKINLIWAKDGAEAVKILNEFYYNINLFLIDIEMPNMNGIELLEWLKSKPKYVEIKKVAVTASVFASMKEEYTKAGFDLILEKPFSRRDLFAILDKVFEGNL